MSHKPNISNPRLIKEEAELMKDFTQAKLGIEDPTQIAGKTNVTEIQKIQGTLMTMGMKLKGVKVEQDKMAKQIQEIRGTLSEIYGSEATQKWVPQYLMFAVYNVHICSNNALVIWCEDLTGRNS